MTEKIIESATVALDKLPAGFRCNEDNGPVADIIKFLDGCGAPEPSSARKHLGRLRQFDYQIKQVGGGPDLLKEIMRLELRREDLERRAGRCPTCGHRGEAPDLQALRQVKLKIVRLRRELEDRRVILADLQTQRRTEQVRLYKSGNQAAAAYIVTLGIQEKLEADRDLYGEMPEEIPEEVVAAWRQVRDLEKLTARLQGLVNTPVSLGMVFNSLDEDLEDALRTRLGSTVVQRPKRPGIDPSASLDKEVGGPL